MTDPSDGMRSFQKAISKGQVQLQRGSVDPDLHVHLDHPNGEPRLTYVRLRGKTVTAFAVAIVDPPYDGKPCLGLGYAVPSKYRNQGRATEVVKAALAEMKEGMGRSGVTTFYVEAIVGENNLSSQRVAEKAISATPTQITDQVSGLPALQYILKIEN